MKKYKLTDESIDVCYYDSGSQARYVKLYRIESLIDFMTGDNVYSIKKGDKGGFVESESNLSQEGTCWIFDDSYVCNNGRVEEFAYIFSKSIVKGNAVVSGKAVIHESYIQDNAKVYGSAYVSDKSVINDNAEVYDSAKIYNNSYIADDAKVYGTCLISEKAHIQDNAKVYGSAEIHGNVRISDDAEVFEYARIFDSVLIDGYAKISGTCIVKDNVWIGGYANVKGDVNVNGTARICGNAVIKSNKDYMTFKNCWSSNRWFTWTRSNNMWSVGCFYGTGQQLIEKAYKDSESKGKHYELIVKMVDKMCKIDEEYDEDNKYKLTDDTIEYKGHTLYQIVALKNFSDIKKGDRGGYVESIRNLAQSGNCWIYQNAKVYDNALVKGSAKIYGKANIYGNAKVFNNAVVRDNAEVCCNAIVHTYAWVFDSSKVSGNAIVGGEAVIKDNAFIKGKVEIDGKACISHDAVVSDKADYMSFKNNWSNDNWITWTRSNNKWLDFNFYGSGEELLNKVKNAITDSDYKHYKLIVDMVNEFIELDNKYEEV